MNGENKEPVATKPAQFYLDEIERLHDSYDRLNARIARVEGKQRGGAAADPMAGIMLWMAVAYIVSALVPPLLEMWRQRPCSQER